MREEIELIRENWKKGLIDFKELDKEVNQVSSRYDLDKEIDYIKSLYTDKIAYLDKKTNLFMSEDRLFLIFLCEAVKSGNEIVWKDSMPTQTQSNQLF